MIMIGSVGITIQGYKLTIGYEYDNEPMKIGSGAGDSGQAGYESIDLLSVYANDNDWVSLLESYKYTIDLLNAIKETTLKAIQ